VVAVNRFKHAPSYGKNGKNKTGSNKISSPVYRTVAASKTGIVNKQQVIYARL